MVVQSQIEPGVVQVTAYQCRCGHLWVPKDPLHGERPRVCPKCKSARWDRPYQFRRDRKGKKVAITA